MFFSKCDTLTHHVPGSVRRPSLRFMSIGGFQLRSEKCKGRGRRGRSMWGRFESPWLMTNIHVVCFGHVPVVRALVSCPKFIGTTIRGI